jgi:hypothetical protein
MEIILKDLEEIKKSCSRKKYHTEGRKYMTSATYTHTTQSPSLYPNRVQTAMTQSLTERKWGNYTSPF